MQFPRFNRIFKQRLERELVKTNVILDVIETHFFQADRSDIQDLCEGGAWLPVHLGHGGAGEERVRRDGRRRHRGGVRHSSLDNDEQQRVSKQHPGQALLLRVHDVRKHHSF